MGAIALSALAMTAIVALRYLASSGGFAWVTAKVRPGHYAGLESQIGMEIRWSLASAVIYGVPAGIVACGWQQHGCGPYVVDEGRHDSACQHDDSDQAYLALPRKAQDEFAEDIRHTRLE